MTREEQIRQQAYDEYDSEYHAQDDFERGCVSGFVTGAKWADSHPVNSWHEKHLEEKDLSEQYGYTSLIENWMRNHVEEAKQMISDLLKDDTISIADLVSMKETAIKNKISSMKEDLSEGSAIATMYMNKMYGKNRASTKEHLDDRAKKFVRKCGFIKI